MNRYRMANLDCANCAAKIEREVGNLHGVRSVSVNFATGTMSIDAEDMEGVRDLIGRIEPQMNLVALQKQGAALSGGEEESSGHILVVIGLATALFVVGLVFRETLRATPYSLGEYLVYFTAYFLCGYSVLYSAARNIVHGKIFDEHFLMSISTLGAVALRELPEAVGVMLFYKVGEYFEQHSVNRSRRSIRSLLEVRPDYANLKTGDGMRKAAPEEVGVGDIIVSRPGERIPLDGEILTGSSQVDTSPLTGEPVPKLLGEGDQVLAGEINKTGALTIRVTRPFGQSSISKILDLVENAAVKKSKTEKFITRFARYYTPAVVAGAALIALVPPLLTGAAFSGWIYRALVVLIMSCPCALVISIPLGYFGGVGGASRKGLLVKGSNFLDVLAELKTVVFDKTGTLTKGVFNVTDVVPKNGYGRNELLRMAAKAESHSNHPIALSIMNAYGRKTDYGEATDYEEIGGFGIRARVEGKIIVAGNDRLLHREQISHDRCDLKGTAVHLAIDGVYAGYIAIGDEIRGDARRIAADLKTLGVEKVLMLTGDNVKAAADVADKLNLDGYAADLLPEEKVADIERLLDDGAHHGKVAFVGDGINDAPVIARADVGIAMGGIGSDAAIDTADVVIMSDAPSKVVQAIEMGRRTHAIVRQNIIFALAVKAGFIVLGIAGVATMWEAVFADMGVALIALFNAMRAMK